MKGKSPTANSEIERYVEGIGDSPLVPILTTLQGQHTFRNRSGFSISSIGSCAAQQLFDIAGFPKSNPPTGRTLLTWRLGNIVEQEVYSLLDNAGYVVVGKQKEMVGAAPPREGHVDGFLLLNNKLWCFDVKSANGRSFDEWTRHAGIGKSDVMRNGWAKFDPRATDNPGYRPVREYSPTYYFQAQGYLNLINSRPEYAQWRLDNGMEIPDALAQFAEQGYVPIATDGFYFLVYCKDDSRLYQEFVPYDQEIVERRLDALNMAYMTLDSWDDLDKEERDETLKINIRDWREEKRVLANGRPNWKCERCSFSEICWDKE